MTPFLLAITGYFPLKLGPLDPIVYSKDLRQHFVQVQPLQNR